MVGRGTLEVAVYLYFHVYSPISISPSSPPLLVSPLLSSPILSPSLEEIKPELSSATSAAGRTEVRFVTLTGVTIPYRRNIGGLLSGHTDLLYWQFHTPTYTVTRAHLFPYVEAMEEYQSQFIWGTAREIRIGWILPPPSFACASHLGLLTPGLVAAGGLGGGSSGWSAPSVMQVVALALIHAHLLICMDSARNRCMKRATYKCVRWRITSPLAHVIICKSVCKSFCRSFSPRPCLTLINCKYLSLYFLTSCLKPIQKIWFKTTSLNPVG